MQTINVEILNPGAKKLLQDLADMKLIAISESEENNFLNAIKKIRQKKIPLSIEDITKEVETVRKKRYAKKSH